MKKMHGISDRAFMSEGSGTVSYGTVMLFVMRMASYIGTCTLHFLDWLEEIILPKIANNNWTTIPAIKN